MRSLQFFDIDGTAIHKVFLTDQSNLEAYEKIVEKYEKETRVKSFIFKNSSPGSFESGTARLQNIS